MIDRSVILNIIWIIGGVLAILIVGIVYTSVVDKPIDAGISALAGSALGYLGGILTNVSRSSSKHGDAVDVKMTNTPAEAVPVYGTPNPDGDTSVVE